MTTEPPFRAIMEQLRSGDQEAAELVVKKFGRRLIGLAAARLPAPVRAKEDEDDAVQSALKSFFNRQKKGEFDPEDWDDLGTLLTYLTICKVDRRIRKYLAQKRDVRRESSADSGCSQEDSRPKWEAAGPDPTADEKAAAEETLNELLKKLPSADQQVVTLRLQGYQVGEIAAHVGKDERTVYRVLATVRERVSTMLGLAS